MAFEPDFLTMMPHTIAVIPFLRTDFHGANVYDEDNPRTYRCRIVGKGLALRRGTGEEDAIIVDLYIDARNDAFRPQDQIYLPSDAAWIDEAPVIFSIGRFTDPDGHHHTKIQCGWRYHRQGQ